MQAFYVLANALALFGLSVAQTPRHSASAYKESPGLLKNSVQRGLDETSNSALDCLPPSEIPVQGLNLTAREQELLSQLCWPRGYQNELNLPTVTYKGRGIPEGVQCNLTTW
jgi:hypothetical protein